MNLKILCLKGQEIQPYINDLTNLRIDIFKEYPYLYAGTIENEISALQTYINSPESIMVLAFDGEQVIGVATANPLKFERAECQQPFLDLGMNITDIFYFGESVLKKSYRGQQIYRHFFKERELAAKNYGCNICAFCAIERPINDPKAPEGYKPLDEVWRHFGYEKHPEISAHYRWKDIGEQKESEKPMVFWLKQMFF
jgi:hypothetical protein